MTINDIMLRDMMDAEKQEREHREAKADWRRDFTTRSDRRRWNLLEFAALAVAIALFALLAWCCVSDAAHVFNISR